MERRTRENFLYVGGELVSRFGKPTLIILTFLVLGGGVMWGFQKIDTYLTPHFSVEQKSAGQAHASSAANEARITIPKIGVEAGIIFVESTDPKDFLQPLKNGVAHYPSALPGQKGASIILGHSAPPGWLGNFYDGVFSNLKELEQGDRILVSFNGESYVYKITGKVFLNRGQDIPAEAMGVNRSTLLLLSCWPPGINNKRIMIQAEIV